MNQHQESIFFHYILSEHGLLTVTKPDFFINPVIKETFSLAKEHALKYKEAPSKEQLIELISIKGLSEKINNDIVDALYNSKDILKQYGDQWLSDNVGSWVQVRNLDNVMRKAAAYMKLTKVTAENASEVVEKVRGILTTETAIDFSFGMGLDFFDANSHKQSNIKRMSSGYDYVDICTKGGYWKGSLIVWLGMPKSGKSFWLCNLAAKAIGQGYNTAYVSLELQEEMVTMRIGANLLNIPTEDYEKISEDTDLIRKKLNELKENSLKPLGKLYVKEFGASTASANDIEAHLKKVEELNGYKFDVVVIDYLNIMKNWRNPNSENMYLKIKQISEDVRAMGKSGKWAILSVTQTNRSGWDAGDLELTHIAESAGLLHTVDVLFGIVTNPIMKAAGEYYLKCLADRVAPYDNTRKRFTIDWKYGRIEEDQNAKIQDMDAIINAVANNNFGKKFSKGTQSEIAINSKNIISSIENLQDISITGSGLF